MRIKSATSTGSVGSTSEDGPTPLENPSGPYNANDAFVSLKKPPKNTVNLNLTGAATTPEPTLVKVEGQTPSYQTISGTTLVDGGIAPTDVDQGELGDCFFLSSLASLAQQNPSALQNMVHDNGNGTYTVQLYKKSGSSYTPVKVTVDGEVPELKDSKGVEEPVYADSPDPKELWPAIVEKAYASLQKGYTTLDKGGYETDAMSALTGKSAASYDVSPSNQTALYSMLQKSIAAGKLTTAGTFTDADLKKNLTQLNAKGQATIPASTTYAKLNLVDGHAYTILGVSTQNGQPTVQLRNPWGTEGYEGQGESNGEFSMPLSDFAQLFQEVSVGG